MNIFKTIWRELNTADGFSNDWYGYATNQITHLAMGFAMACIMSQTYFFVFNEFAHKNILWGAIGLIYFAYEMLFQGWKGKDTIEDWVFFSLYGAGAPIMLLSEVEVGSPVLETNSQLVIPVIAVVVAHIFGGIVARIYLKVGTDDN